MHHRLPALRSVSLIRFLLILSFCLTSSFNPSLLVTAEPHLPADRAGLSPAGLHSLPASPVSSIQPLEEYPALGTVVNLSQTPGNSAFSRIAAAGDNLYVAWQDRGLSGDTEIMFRLSQDGGSTFNRAINLSRAPGLDDSYPQMVVLDGTIYVAWEQHRPPYGARDAMLAVSYDGGQSFTEARLVYPTPGDSIGLHLAVSKVGAKTYVYLSWVDLDGNQRGLNLAHSKDGGETFHLSHISDNAFAYKADLAAAGRSVHLVWNGSGNIYNYRGSYAENGYYSGSDREVAKNASDWTIPRIAAADSNVYIFYRIHYRVGEEPNRKPQEQIFWLYSLNGGDSWTAPGEFNTVATGYESGYSTTEAVLAVGDTLYIAWDEKNTGSAARILISTWRNGGWVKSTTVSNPKEQVSGNGGLRLASDGNHVYASWVDSGKLYVALSSDGGSGWEIISAYNPGSPYFGAPDLAAKGPTFYLTWTDHTNNQIDVLFRVGSQAAADLSVSELELVQAPAKPTQLVAGKATKLRVRVDNYYATVQNVKATIIYQENLDFKQYTENVRLQPGSNLLYLPQQPIPGAGGAYFRPPEGTLYVHLALEKVLGEENEDNNEAEKSITVKASRPVHILYRPMGGISDPIPTCAEVIKIATNSTRFLEAIFPVDDRQVTTTISCLPLFFADAELMETYGSGADAEVTIRDSVFSRLAMDRAATGADKVVGVVKAGWFDAHGMPSVLGLAPLDGFSTVVDASATSAVGATTVHELGHNFNLVPNTLPANNGDWHFERTTTAEGYWVVRDQARQGSFELMIPYMYPGEGQLGGLHWISNQAFNYLLNKLNPSPAPVVKSMSLSSPSEDSGAVIFVQGTVSKTGVAELGPWYRQFGVPDLPLDQPGTYRWEYYNSSDELVGETGFDLSFTRPPDGNNSGELQAASFAFSIPDLPGTKRIVLRSGSQLLAERTFSANPPEVSVTYPNGGEVLITGQDVTATWTSSDPDGDELAFMLSLSKDNGATWIPLALDIEETAFTFKVPENILSEEMLLRVSATDGVNTASDASDDPFSLRRKVLQAGCFGSPLNVTQTKRVTSHPVMAASGNHVYMVYEAQVPPWGEYNLFFQASHDGGQTWDAAIHLVRGYMSSLRPQIASAGDYVYLSWGNGYYSVRPTLYISPDNGRNFTPPVIMTEISKAGSPGIYASGEDVFFWWMDYSSSTLRYYLNTSHDHGATFTEPVQIASAQDFRDIKVVVDGSQIYATWIDWRRNYDLYYTYSSDGGSSFAVPKVLESQAGSFANPSLVASGGKVFISISKDINFYGEPEYTYLLLLTDPAADPIKIVVDSTDASIREAKVLVNGEHVHMFWVKWDAEDAPQKGLYHAVSHDGGLTFSEPVRLSTPGTLIEMYTLLSIGSEVWIAGVEIESMNALKGSLFVRVSTDNGDSFDLPHQISQTSLNYLPRETIVRSGETVLLGWAEAQPSENADIMFARSAACGPGGSSGIDPNPAPPTLDEIILPGAVLEGSSTLINLAASDPNYDALIFSGENLPPFADLISYADGTARLTLSPPFGSAGSYPGITIRVSDGVESDSQTFDLLVSPNKWPPVARAGGPYLVPEGSSLGFDATASFDPKGYPLTASWSYNGQTYPGLTAAAPALDDANQQVTVVVRNSDGAENEASTWVQVYNLPPVVTAAPKGLQLATFSDPGVLDTHTATVDWGDGSPIEAALVTESGGKGAVSGIHLYTRPGSYKVTITVRDKDGGIGTASFTWTKQFVYLPLVVGGK